MTERPLIQFSALNSFQIFHRMPVSHEQNIQLQSWSSFLCLNADQTLCRQRKKVSFEEKNIMSLTSVLCCFLSTNWKLLKIQRKGEISSFFSKLFLKRCVFLPFLSKHEKKSDKTFYILQIFRLVVVGIKT